MALLWGFLSLSLVFFFLSYFWIDQEIVLFLAESFPPISRLQTLIEFKKTQESLFSLGFAGILLFFTLLQILFLLREKRVKISSFKLFSFLGAIALVLALSYPLLSYDLFSYLFGAKIVWHYHQNPYLAVPETFRGLDPWLKFTHWTQSPYVYGPVFLFLSLIPAFFLQCQGLVSNYLSLKLVYGAAFFLTGLIFYELSKDKGVVALWFLNPFLLLEFLVNNHNDLFMLGLFVFSLFLWKRQYKIAGFSVFLLSILTKFVSIVLLPFYFLPQKYLSLYFKLMTLFFLGFYLWKGGYAWYYTWVYLALPFAGFSRTAWIFFFAFQFLVLFVNYCLTIGGETWGVSFLLARRWLFLVLPLFFVFVDLPLFKKDFQLLKPQYRRIKNWLKKTIFVF